MELNQRNKQLVAEYWRALGDASGKQLEAVAGNYLEGDAKWHGPDPVNDLEGVEAFVSGFWQPLLQSVPDLKRHSHLFFGGKSNGRIDGSNDGRMWVCGTGYLTGTFAEDYLSITATRKEVNIRWGEFCCIEDNRIVETYFLLDLIDLMQQAGFHVLPPSRGVDGVYPPPQAGNGILLGLQDDVKSKHTLEHIRKFIFEGLNSYDQSELESMGMADYFHPDVKWYGPGGIGACLSLQEFEDKHQKWWLRAFPDRQVQDLDALFADGSYSGAPGWAGVTATHSGEYLDCPATNRPVEFNGLDYWKLEDGKYVENWVFVDMIHLFRQFGIDLFDRLAERA